MELFKGLNYFYCAGAILAVTLLILTIKYYLGEKATSKVLITLGDNMFWWAAIWFFIFLIFMTAAEYNTGSLSLNKILKSCFFIGGISTPVLNSLAKTVLTTKGVEIRLIKEYTRVLIKWSDIIEWSVLYDEITSSAAEISYKYKYKGRIRKAKIQVWAEEKEEVIKIFQENAA